MTRVLSLSLTLLLISYTTVYSRGKRGVIRTAKRLPIIDMHIHDDTMEDFGGGNLSICLGDGKVVLPAIDPISKFEIKDVMQCEKTIKSSASDAALKTETVAELRRHNVKRAVALGDLTTVTDWVSAIPLDLYRASTFQIDP